VVLSFRRRLGYYLFHTYIPTCLIVVMSWISFWIRPEAVPARVTLGVTSLLTLHTQHANSQKALPPVSYIKVIYPSIHPSVSLLAILIFFLPDRARYIFNCVYPVELFAIYTLCLERGKGGGGVPPKSTGIYFSSIPAGRVQSGIE
jgi:hypothetical protein